MTITALNEILVNLANSDFRVNQAYTGDVYDINTKENRFGCFVATPMTATRTDGGVITYHYVMYYIDRLTDDEANMDLVQTDAVNVLKRVIDNLGYNGIEMGDGYQFTLFKHQFDDWCAGAFVDIDFIVPDMDCGGFHIIPEEVDLRPVTITSNGKYVPEGFDGYSSVMVNVEGGSDVTKEWVDEEIDRKTQGFATEDYVLAESQSTKRELGAEMMRIEGKIPSLDGYATEAWVEGKGYLTEHQDISNLATKSEVEQIADAVDKVRMDICYTIYAVKPAGGYNYSHYEGMKDNNIEAWTKFKNKKISHCHLLLFDGNNTYEYTCSGYEPSNTMFYSSEGVNARQLMVTSVTDSGIFIPSNTNVLHLQAQGYNYTDGQKSAFRSNISVYSKKEIDDKGYLTEHQDISGKVDKSSIWTGTQAQWGALTDAQKASYTIALITE